jgi:hypothetical protein
MTAANTMSKHTRKPLDIPPPDQHRREVTMNDAATIPIWNDDARMKRAAFQYVN